MDKQDLLEDFKTILDEKIPNHGFDQEVVANVGRVIGEAIKSKSEQYEQELLAIEEEKAKLAETEKKMQEDVEDLKSQLESSQSELDSLKQEIEARKTEEAFDARMEQIDSEYELSEEDRVLLASEVKSISLEDSDFEEYKSKISVMWAHKNKTYIEEQEKAFNDRLEAEIQKRESSEESKASDEAEEVEEKSIEEVLEDVKPEEETLANNNNDIATEEPSLREKFAKAFDKENLTIKI
jgi:chromosome segregation ATPase